MKKGIFTLLICIPAMVFAQWSNNSTINTEVVDTTGMQVQPKVIVNPDGESYISWFSESGNMQFDVYMQRLDVNGNKLWDEEGLLISNHTTISWVTDYGLAIDHEGCAILVTQDERTGSSNVYAYRISPEGEFLWGDDGIALTNDTNFNPSPKVLIDQEGNIIVNWGVESNDTFAKMAFQKLSTDGQLLWGENVVISCDSMHLLMPQIILSEDSATTVVWIQTVSTDTVMGDWPNMYAYAQKINKNGNFAWPENVAIDTSENMPLAFFDPSMTSDGNNGFFISWMAFPTGQYYTSFVQYISSDGITQWAVNGISVSNAYQDKQSMPKLIYLAQHEELFVFWNELDQYNFVDALFGQRFSIDGERQWTDEGQMFDGWYSYSDTLTSLIGISIATDDDFTVFFEKEFLEFDPDTNIINNYHAMRINHEGDFVWDNEKILISSAISEKFSLEHSDLINNQWITVWADNRNDPMMEWETGVYAQNISIDGQLGIITGISKMNILSDNSFSNFPNPFQNRTTIEYELTQSENVNLSLIDVNGRLVKQLYSGSKSQGIHSIELNGSDLSSGIYIMKLQMEGSVVYHKIVKK